MNCPSRILHTVAFTNVLTFLVNMFKSTAMRLMIHLLDKISEAISPQTRVDVGQLVIDSFIHVRREETTKALIFMKIPYTYLKDIFPERIADPGDSDDNKPNIFFSYFRNRKKKEE